MEGQKGQDRWPQGKRTGRDEDSEKAARRKQTKGLGRTEDFVLTVLFFLYY